MKHYFYILFSVIMFAANAMAEDVVIQTKDGKKYNGELIGKTDSTLTIYNRYTLKTYIFNANGIVEANTSQGGKYTVENGKIVGNSYEELYLLSKEQEKLRMGDPNYAIGKALKTVGGFSLGIGVPALALGTILVAIGQSDMNKIKTQITTSITTDNINVISYLKEMNKKQEQLIEDQNMVTAGLVLMPMGGALTIVGIPLYVRGKSIVSLSLQVSENGAGVVVNF